MAEQEQTPSTEQATSTEQTLDDVYKQYNVDSAAQEFNPQPQQRTEQPAPQQQPQIGADIPDPILDQAGFKAYLARQSTETRQALANATQLQQQYMMREMKRSEEADIKSAVQAVKEKIGDIDDDFVEIALGQKARRDPKFASIYENRHKNPNAWKAALGAVASEFKGKYQFRQDNQLTENVRAAKQSTQSSLTAKESASDNPIEERLSKAEGNAFDSEWQRIRSAGM